MPVWHAKTKALVAAGELTVIGIVQEQHPDRTQLYADWQQFDFPILWDPFGLTGLEVVPVVTAIDEHGVVRIGRLDPRRFEDQFMAGFMDRAFEAPAENPAPERIFDLSLARTAGGAVAADLNGPGARVARALATLLVSGPDGPDIDDDVRTLEWAAAESGDPVDLFRAGVARRLRADGPHARPGDFQGAVDAWSAALRARPNQYIWRRRIQQWGPRLDKPYAFYDWVDQALRELGERGQDPIALRVPLSGSEVATASRAIPGFGQGTDAAPEAPDPAGAVTRDRGELVGLDVAVAQHTGVAGSQARQPIGASRVHVALTPKGGAHWTPDTDPPLVWIDLPQGWTAESPLVRFARLPDESALQGTLRVDFELSTPTVPLGPPPSAGSDGAPPPSEVNLAAYALYSVCLADGTCVFRRQDFGVRIALPAAPPAGDDAGAESPRKNGEGHDREARDGGR